MSHVNDTRLCIRVLHFCVICLVWKNLKKPRAGVTTNVNLYRFQHSLTSFLTSRSVPANVAPRKLQFFSLAFFSVATRRFIPVIWLPSMSTPFRLAPIEHEAYYYYQITNKYIRYIRLATKPWQVILFTKDMKCCCIVVLPSRLAFSPDGSSKLHPFRDAPSALEQSIFTPWRLAPWSTWCWDVKRSL